MCLLNSEIPQLAKCYAQGLYDAVSTCSIYTDTDVINIARTLRNTAFTVI